jgi:hypothetical protein
LLAPPAPNADTLVVKDGVHVLAKPGEDRTLLVTLNAVDQPAEVRFELPERLRGREVRVLFEGRAVEMDGCGFRDGFEALERHVYVVE